MSEFNSTTDTLIGKLRTMADGKTTIRLHDELGNATMDMISNVS
jgi:hypothetical protein